MKWIKTSISDCSIGNTLLKEWLAQQGFSDVAVFGYYGGSNIRFKNTEDATLFMLKHSHTNLHDAVTVKLTEYLENMVKMTAGANGPLMTRFVTNSLLAGKYKEFFNHKLATGLQAIKLEIKYKQSIGEL